MDEDYFEKLLEGEMTRFIKVWTIALLGITWCYFAGKLFSKGWPRLAAVIPSVVLFLFLPLQLNALHLAGTTGFFLSWLANFKLLLFAVDQGPLAATPGISFPRFFAVACFPIKLSNKNPSYSPGGGTRTWLLYAIKGILLGLVVKLYEYRIHFNPTIMNILYTLHMYLALDIILAMAAAGVRGLLGVELEPQFDEPYLSNSLQDFWGRRWNIMASRILRPTVYTPVRDWCARIVDREIALLPAVISTFLVSGVMHELIFYYLGRIRPTWEVTWFFVLHGVCLAVEIIFKKALNRRFPLPTPVSVVITIGFVMLTAFWLFFPPFLRVQPVERGVTEITAAGDFLRYLFGMVKSVKG